MSPPRGKRLNATELRYQPARKFGRPVQALTSPSNTSHRGKAIRSLRRRSALHAGSPYPARQPPAHNCRLRMRRPPCPAQQQRQRRRRRTGTGTGISSGSGVGNKASTQSPTFAAHSRSRRRHPIPLPPTCSSSRCLGVPVSAGGPSGRAVVKRRLQERSHYS